MQNSVMSSLKTLKRNLIFPKSSSNNANNIFWNKPSPFLIPKVFEALSKNFNYFQLLQYKTICKKWNSFITAILLGKNQRNLMVQSPNPTDVTNQLEQEYTNQYNEITITQVNNGNNAFYPSNLLEILNSHHRKLAYVSTLAITNCMIPKMLFQQLLTFLEPNLCVLKMEIPNLQRTKEFANGFLVDKERKFPNLKVLHYTDFNSPCLTSLQEISTVFPGLTELSLNDMQTNYTSIKCQELPNLRRLSVKFPLNMKKCTNPFINILLLMKLELRHLELINFQSIQTADIKKLLMTQTLTLETLTLVSNYKLGQKSSNNSPILPEELPKLWALQISEHCIVKNVPFTLSLVPNITQLSMTFNKDPKFEAVFPKKRKGSSECPNLKVQGILINKIGQQELKELSKWLPNVTKISIEFCNDELLKIIFTNFHKIKVFHFGTGSNNNFVTDSGIIGLPAENILEILNIASCKEIVNETTKNIGCLKELEELFVSNMEVGTAEENAAQKLTWKSLIFSITQLSKLKKVILHKTLTKELIPEIYTELNKQGFQYLQDMKVYTPFSVFKGTSTKSIPSDVFIKEKYPELSEETRNKYKPNNNYLDEIPLEHPIAIDTVFNTIMLYLDSADLMACAQIWRNCYRIYKHFLDNTRIMAVHSLDGLTNLKNDGLVGQLYFQYLGYRFHNRSTLRILADHPKFRYLTRITLISNYQDYYYLGTLIRTVGHKLIELYVKKPGNNIWPMLNSIKAPELSYLFPVRKLGQNGQWTDQIFKSTNMRRLQLYASVSISGVAETLPNLVELNLEGNFTKNIPEDFSQLKKSKISPFANLRKLSIHYQNTKPLIQSQGHFGTLISLNVQLRYLELVNVTNYTSEFNLMDFLKKQANTLEVLKLLSTYRLLGHGSYQSNLQHFQLQGKFLKLNEISLSNLYVNDLFNETLKSIPKATKIFFEFAQDTDWETAFNFMRSNNARTRSNRLMSNIQPIVRTNIKEIGITRKINKEQLKDLKTTFPNCDTLLFKSCTLEILKCLYSTFTNLKSLTLKGIRKESLINDSEFLGIDSNIIDTLEDQNFATVERTQPWIGNLQELESLVLSFNIDILLDLEMAISSKTLLYGIFQLPKLSEVLIYGNNIQSSGLVSLTKQKCSAFGFMLKPLTTTDGNRNTAIFRRIEIE